MAGANIGGVGVLILPAEGLWRLCVAGNCVISDCGTVTCTGKAGIALASAGLEKKKPLLRKWLNVLLYQLKFGGPYWT